MISRANELVAGWDPELESKRFSVFTTKEEQTHAKVSSSNTVWDKAAPKLAASPAMQQSSQGAGQHARACAMFGCTLRPAASSCLVLVPAGQLFPGLCQPDKLLL